MKKSRRERETAPSGSFLRRGTPWDAMGQCAERTHPDGVRGIEWASSEEE